MINNITVYAFATKRNATKRNANHNYILINNYLKFYLSQFFDFFFIIFISAILRLFYAYI